MDSKDTSSESTLLLQSKLTCHVLLKGWQAGSVLGVLAAVPLQAMWRKSFSLPYAAHTLGLASLIGVGLSGTALAAKLPSITREGYEDRVYRLHYNKGQNRVDEISNLTSCIGLAATFLAARFGIVEGSPLRLIGGAAAGSAFGVLLHIATK